MIVPKDWPMHMMNNCRGLIDNLQEMAEIVGLYEDEKAKKMSKLLIKAALMLSKIKWDVAEAWWDMKPGRKVVFDTKKARIRVKRLDKFISNNIPKQIWQSSFGAYTHEDGSVAAKKELYTVWYLIKFDINELYDNLDKKE